jgi:hypothetical protein
MLIMNKSQYLALPVFDWYVHRHSPGEYRCAVTDDPITRAPYDWIGFDVELTILEVARMSNGHINIRTYNKRIEL